MSWISGGSRDAKKNETKEYVFIGTKVIAIPEMSTYRVFIYLKESDSEEVIMVQGYPRNTVTLPKLERYPDRWIDSVFWFEEEREKEKKLQEDPTSFITI